MARKNKPVTIIVAAHKQYRMPDDSMYLPVHVGAEGKKAADGSDLDLGYVKDNTGDNISEKNPHYSELTGLYWAWKHINSRYVGLVHYRRYFAGRRVSGDPFGRILLESELRPMLRRYRVFVPRKRRYVIETLYSHYAHTHYGTQLDETRNIIREKYPEYLETYDCVVKRTSGYMFNMMIMRRDLFREYCSWLFDILFELEDRVDTSGLNFFQGRFYGRISEIIFNVWLEQQLRTGRLREDQIKELPFIYMEKIDWFKKGTSFLKAKFLHQKYESSF